MEKHTQHIKNNSHLKSADLDRLTEHHEVRLPLNVLFTGHWLNKDWIAAHISKCYGSFCTSRRIPAVQDIEIFRSGLRKYQLSILRCLEIVLSMRLQFIVTT